MKRGRKDKIREREKGKEGRREEGSREGGSWGNKGNKIWL